jgi:hypothetical protein
MGRDIDASVEQPSTATVIAEDTELHLRSVGNVVAELSL